MQYISQKSNVTFIVISGLHTVTLINQSLYCPFRFSDTVSFIFTITESSCSLLQNHSYSLQMMLGSFIHCCNYLFQHAGPDKSEIRNQNHFRIFTVSRDSDTKINTTLQKISVVPPRAIPPTSARYFSGTDRSQYHLPLSDISAARISIYSSVISYAMYIQIQDIQNFHFMKSFINHISSNTI